MSFVPSCPFFSSLSTEIFWCYGTCSNWCLYAGRCGPLCLRRPLTGTPTVRVGGCMSQGRTGTGGSRGVCRRGDVAGRHSVAGWRHSVACDVLWNGRVWHALCLQASAMQNGVLALSNASRWRNECTMYIVCKTNGICLTSCTIHTIFINYQGRSIRSMSTDLFC